MAAPASPVNENVGQRTVYCGNLPWSVGYEELKEFATQCGEVEHAEVLSYRDGRKTGSGIVRYVQEESAQQAIATLNDKDLNGRPILVREDKENGKGPGSVPGKGGADKGNRAACQIYVGNLSYRTSWQDLKEHFRQCGEIEYCDILADRTGGQIRSAGAGLIRFKTPDEAQKAITSMNETELDGRTIFVREDREGREIKGKSSKGKGFGKGFDGKGGKGSGKGKGGYKGGQEFAIRIPKLDEGFTWKDLKDAFSRNGHYPSHTVCDLGGGIVKFPSEEQARAALEGMWHKQLGNSIIEPQPEF